MTHGFHQSVDHSGSWSTGGRMSWIVCQTFIELITCTVLHYYIVALAHAYSFWSRESCKVRVQLMNFWQLGVKVFQILRLLAEGSTYNSLVVSSTNNGYL